MNKPLVIAPGHPAHKPLEEALVTRHSKIATEKLEEALNKDATLDALYSRERIPLFIVALNMGADPLLKAMEAKGFSFPRPTGDANDPYLRLETNKGTDFLLNHRIADGSLATQLLILAAKHQDGDQAKEILAYKRFPNGNATSAEKAKIALAVQTAGIGNPKSGVAEIILDTLNDPKLTADTIDFMQGYASQNGVRTFPYLGPKQNAAEMLARLNAKATTQAPVVKRMAAGGVLPFEVRTNGAAPLPAPILKVLPAIPPADSTGSRPVPDQTPIIEIPTPILPRTQAAPPPLRVVPRGKKDPESEVNPTSEIPKPNHAGKIALAGAATAAIGAFWGSRSESHALTDENGKKKSKSGVMPMLLSIAGLGAAAYGIYKLVTSGNKQIGGQ